MKLLVASAICIIAAVLAVAEPTATSCPTDGCGSGTRANCVCSGKTSPIGVEDTPQFLTLAFTDAVTDLIYQEYYKPILSGRSNPDGKQISATFYVPHEYTDYERVNDLYNEGYEIAVHSISKSPLASYWKDADLDTLVQEFQGQKEIIVNFANILEEDVIGARIPNLEMQGNLNFEAYKTAGLQYDNSWTARNDDPYFPYTLDHLSDQPCIIGGCPTDAFPGSWVLPIIDIVDTENNNCNSLLGCTTPNKTEDISKWLNEQLDRFVNDNRAPLTLTLNSAWFITGEEHLNGFVKFLDSLKERNNVFLVSHGEVLEWMKNPTPLSSYETHTYTREQQCNAIVCPLPKGDEIRYMKSCVACPKVYPWLGNPLGVEQEEGEEEEGKKF